MADKKRLELTDDQLEEVSGGEDTELPGMMNLYLQCAVDARHVWLCGYNACPVCGSTKFVWPVVPE